MIKLRKLSQLFGLLDSLSPRTCAYKAGCWMSWEKV